MLSHKDWAGSGYRICEAVNRHAKHSVVMRVGIVKSAFGIRGCTEVIGKDGQDKVEWADVIHLKGDWPHGFYTKKYGLDFMGKPIIQTVSGGLFRKKNCPPGYGQGKFKPEQYRDCAVRTSMEPDLLYPEYDGILTPYAVDMSSESRPYKITTPPLIMHVPSDKCVKNTSFIQEVIGEVGEAMVVPKGKWLHYIFLQKVSGATLYLDQFGVGAYGNAAVQAMRFGVPVAAYLSEESFRYAPDWYRDECPVITTELDKDKWARLLRGVLDGDLWELSKRTKSWCEKTHSYESVAKQWDKIYASV